eukprot:g1903.t1
MLRICLPLATLGLFSSAELAPPIPDSTPLTHAPFIMTHGAELAPPIPDSTPLTHAPFIMTHDAGSGYLGAGLVNAWTKTQSLGLAEQLACGARAFDARPLNDKAKGLVWHHGSVEVDYLFKQSVKDIVAWCAKNPTELVMMSVWDCEGDGCMAELDKELAAQNVTNIKDCKQMQTTYGEAMKLGALPGGGAFIVVTGPATPNSVACAITDYKSANSCCGTGYKCWKSDKTHDKAMNNMLDFLDDFARRGLSDTAFMQAQALWQEGANSVVVGTLRNSSLVKDEHESGLNALLVEQIKAGRWGKNISII